MIEAIIKALRPLDIPGTNRVLGRFLPSAGERFMEVAPGVRIRIDLANGHQRMMYVGCFERNVRTWLRGLLRPGDTFVDAGANVGFFTLYGAHLVGPSGRVVAIEPFPSNFRTLSDNISRNNLGYVKPQQVALGKEKGVLTLYAPPAEENRDFNVSVVRFDGYRQIDVPVETIDDKLGEWVSGPVRLMKVDVEGSEPQLFAGGAAAAPGRSPARGL